MKIINSIQCLCPSCMETHNVKIVKEKEKIIYKNQEVIYDANYTFCENTSELFMTEEQMKENHEKMIDAYQKIKKDN